MKISIKDQVWRVICESLENVYPQEGCGILLGKNETVEYVEKAHPMQNRTVDSEGEEHFRIDPLELYRVEQKAEEEGLSVIGFYHSHPDHAAILSEEDKKYMIPGMLYLVVSLQNGRCREWNYYKKN